VPIGFHEALLEVYCRFTGYLTDYLYIRSSVTLLPFPPFLNVVHTHITQKKTVA
jgi:hypothetical protein